ncbi:hypothetical protein WME75_25555 [Sorangium sp. So ce1014]|uniref:hypothetical protein n=1 Tax=Sorangium sp. So ce1014 TaxID=3133326 RepID=UPI003F61EE32
MAFHPNDIAHLFRANVGRHEEIELPEERLALVRRGSRAGVWHFDCKAVVRRRRSNHPADLIHEP